MRVRLTFHGRVLGDTQSPAGTEDDWAITPHGMTLCRALVDCSSLSGVASGRDVLELGGGLGNHTMLLWRQSPRLLVTTEINSGRAGTLRQSMKLNGCQCVSAGDETAPEGGDSDGKVDPRAPPRALVQVADWLNASVPTHDGKVDLLVTNPPFAYSGKFNR